MKKTLIALSLAALPVAAMADVTLYGQVKAGVAVQQVTDGKTTTGLVDFGSRIGFKGEEDLGNGVAAIWKLENGFSVAGKADPTSSGWNGREAYVGLKTGFGTVRAGKISTQLDDMGDVDPWEYSGDRTPELGLNEFTRTGEKVLSVRYDSPEVAGFQANVQFTPRDSHIDGNKIVAVNDGDREDGIFNAGTNKNVSAYYLGLNYQNSGFFAKYGFGYKQAAFELNGKDKAAAAHRLEAGYDANNLFVGVGVQYTDGWEAAYNTDNEAVKRTEVAVTGAYRLGNVTPKLTYAYGDKVKDKVTGRKVDGTQYNQVIVGADYDFSKRTTAFAQAGWARVGSSKDKDAVTGGLVGLRHKF